MSERMRNITAAYNKGALASKSPSTVCPYGHTKMELLSWWHAGKEDAKVGKLDRSMCYDSTLKRLGVEDL